MNGKKAKALRRQAAKVSVGLPYRTYRTVRQITRDGFERYGTQLGDCFRRNYQRLKVAP